MKVAIGLTLTAALTLTSAQAASLADHLPAGALLTLETRNAGSALDRLSGLIAGVLEDSGMDEEVPSEMVEGIGAMLKDSVGREGLVGVFTVGRSGGRFSPEVLAVARVGALSRDMAAELVPQGKGARVGNYTFGRSDDMFIGQSGGLIYASSNKALLMSYLGRLSGKAGPRLNAASTYATPTRAIGAQEISLYANLSAVAKVVRGEFARMGVPRLLSPLVDGLDTLGQYAGGLRTTASGLTTTSAHVVNPQGKDQPLSRMLSHTTDFTVQEILPADVEAVQARACHPESGAYLGRWLTRLDLFEPFGFLTDSQLASHLERSGRYLGDECAQVTLAGGLKASLNSQDPVDSLRHVVTYQRVKDQAAAQAHLPEYARSLNDAVSGLRKTIFKTLTGLKNADLPGSMGRVGATGIAAGMGAAKEFDALLGDLKMVYGFRDGYLITAWTEEALRAALAPAETTLASSEAFRGEGLNLKNAGGWTYQPDLADLNSEDLLSALPEDLRDEELDDIFGPMAETGAGLINRFNGMTSQSSVQGNVIIGKTNVRYDW
ncbi:hypothetical protein [Deinococcus deserti]|uniref:Uncharacterized protein n=1 Tax=Deinococcus deserti (strain DSM 17065 / CIP 109153 / LMG 22923 / VCD115) TaxID=546414 RepID=C1CXS4_DEIDV|nr:hypothetical protein [Deinococcus deserti]ACO44880.1 Hypothetical protein, precursor [Deinococcus deserti VCD115]